MKKLLYIGALSLLLLTACGDSPSTVEDIVEEYGDKQEIKSNDGIYSISITDDKLHAGSKSSILKETKQLLAELSKIDDVKSVTVKWLGPTDDGLGNQSTGEILSIMFDGETYKQVNWDNVDNVDIEAIATGYKQHDALK